MRLINRSSIVEQSANQRMRKPLSYMFKPDLIVKKSGFDLVWQ